METDKNNNLFKKIRIIITSISFFASLLALYLSFDANNTAKESNTIAKESNQIVKQSNFMANEANKIAEKSNVIANEANKTAEQSNVIANEANKTAEKSNVIANEANKTAEQSNKIANEENRIAAQFGKINAEAVWNGILNEYHKIDKEIRNWEISKDLIRDGHNTTNIQDTVRHVENLKAPVEIITKYKQRANIYESLMSLSENYPPFLNRMSSVELALPKKPSLPIKRVVSAKMDAIILPKKPK